jgi:hypothetical protein
MPNRISEVNDVVPDMPWCPGAMFNLAGPTLASVVVRLTTGHLQHFMICASSRKQFKPAVRQHQAPSRLSWRRMS